MTTIAIISVAIIAFAAGAAVGGYIAIKSVAHIINKEMEN